MGIYMKNLILLLLLFCGLSTLSQTTYHGFYSYDVDGATKVLIKFPSDTSGTKKFPVLFFSGGNGEIGTDPNIMFNVGVGRQFLLYPSLMPDSIIYCLILPASNQSSMEQPTNLYRVFDFVDSKTRHQDTTNCMLSGISQGATNTIEAPSWPASLNGFGDPSNYRFNRFRKFVESSMCNLRGSNTTFHFAGKGVRMFGGASDATCAASFSTNAYSDIIAAGGHGTVTIIAGGGHNNTVWDSAFSPRASDTLHNIYLWLLGSPVSVPLCTTNISPTNGSTIGTTTTATYTWNPATGATSYNVYYYTGSTPGSPTVSGVTTTTYSITGLVAGTTYKVFVAPVNSAGTATGCATSFTTFTTAVASNTPPTVSAGSDLTINTKCTPTTSITATASDPDGTIASYLWTKLSGPGTPTLTGASTATVTFNGLLTGTYQYKIVVTDNGGATGADTVQLTVHNPTRYVYGTLTGGITLTPTSTTPSMLPGDTLDIPGKYNSVSFANFQASCDSFYFRFTGDTSVTGLTYGTSSMSNCSNLKIDGLKYKRFYKTFFLTDHVSNIRFTNLEVSNDTSIISKAPFTNGQPWMQIGTPHNVNMKYDGDKEKTFHDIMIDHSLINGFSNSSVIATITDTLTNLLTDFTFAYNKVRNLTATGTVGSPQGTPGIFTGIALNFNIHDNDLDSFQANTGACQCTHSEWFFIIGWGKFYNNIGSNAFGSLLRVVPTRLNAIPAYGGVNAFVDIHDNSAFNNLSYSMFEANISSPNPFPNSLVVGGFTKTRTKCYFNTFGRSRIATYGGDYNANIMDVYADSISLHNNVHAAPGIDRTFSPATYNYIVTGTLPALDTANNKVYRYFKDGGFIDSSRNFKIGSTSPLRSAADNSFPTSTISLNSVVRPTFPGKDIGAIQFINAGVPPVANPGVNQTFGQTVNSVNLIGFGTATGATITGYQWSQVSGAASTILSPNTSSTTVSGLTTGSYVFRLTVTDSNGLTGSGDVVIIITPYSFQVFFYRRP
jgi:hypothetical protein